MRLMAVFISSALFFLLWFEFFLGFELIVGLYGDELVSTGLFVASAVIVGVIVVRVMQGRPGLRKVVLTSFLFGGLLLFYLGWGFLFSGALGGMETQFTAGKVLMPIGSVLLGAVVVAATIEVVREIVEVVRERAG